MAQAPREAAPRTTTRASRLDDLWREVLEEPLDDARHQKLIAFAVSSDQIAQAAARYAAFEKEQPAELAALASRWRREIGMRAAAKIMASAPKAQRTAHVGTLTRICFTLFGIGAFVALILGKWLLLVIATPFLAFGVWGYLRARSA